MRANVKPVLEARALNAAREARYARTQEAILASLKGKKLLPTAIRVLSSEQRRREADLRAHIGEHSETFLDPDTNEEVRATDDLMGERMHAEDAAAVAARVKDLKEKGREPFKRPYASYVTRPKIDNFERKTAGAARRVAWPKGVAQQLDDEFAGKTMVEGHVLYPTPQDHPLHELLGVTSRKELEEMILANHKTSYGGALRGILRQAGVRNYSVKEDEIVAPVKNVSRIVPAGTARIQGYPDDAGRRKLSDNIKRMINARSLNWHLEEDARAAARVAGAKADAAGTAWQALRRLNLLRNPRLRLGVLAGGALVGAAAGWSVVDHTQKLTKADETPEPPDDAQDLHRHGTAAEQDMSERLARVFGSVKDDAAGDLLSPRKGSLMETVTTGLDHALRPIDTASRAGIETPIPVHIPGDGGNQKIVNLTLSARSPRVEEYVQNYRKNRIVALAADQAATIKGILLEAARTGMSPQDMARQVRQTIGLTPNQAQSVMNFKQELETNPAAALGRKLRDARYDRTLRRAIDENHPLTADQIQAMTDAYHRKFLAYRAMTIARTEGVGAANNGHVAAVEDLLEKNPGYSVIKTWIATEDERTRPDHIGLHGKSVVGLHTPFKCDSGDMIRWPHDQNADARQVVNCRCTLATRLVHRSLAARRGVGSLQPEAA